MALFVMFTKIEPTAVDTPAAFKTLEKRVVELIKKECRQVHWKLNLAVLGPYDFVDIFEAPDIAEAMKVATIIRSAGQARTEIWAAKDWGGFKQLVEKLEQLSAA